MLFFFDRNITDITVKKMDHSDARYPEPIEDRPFTDVYRMTVTFDDGSQKECNCFLFEDLGPMTPERGANMFKFFAEAIAGEETKAA